ncbi:MAG: acyltransferase family protein, partial [Flavobacterium sp.]
SYFLCRNQAGFAASIFGFPLVSIGYGLMVMGAVSPGSFLYRFNSRITTVVATLSYAIYLTHKIVIHITQDQFGKMGMNVNGNLMFVICIVSSVVGAVLLNRIVEKPFLRLREKLLRSRVKTS